jgi:hypothetical protein
MLDYHILRYLPCREVKLFRYLRRFPYDEWQPVFQQLLDRGMIRYEGKNVVFVSLLPQRSPNI